MITLATTLETHIHAVESVGMSILNADRSFTEVCSTKGRTRHTVHGLRHLIRIGLLENVYTYKEFDSGLYSAHDGITYTIMQ